MNAIDIVGIGQPTKERKHIQNPTLLPNYKQYEKIACDLIRTIGPTIGPSITHMMLKNEDAIANMAFYIMKADWEWNGKGTKEGYRKQRAEWAMYGYVRRTSKQFKRNVVSLNSQITDERELIEIVENKQARNDIGNLERQDTIKYNKGLAEKIIAAASLTPTEKRFLHLYMNTDMNDSEMGRHIGVTREAVRQSRRKTIKKLQKAARYLQTSNEKEQY